MKAMHVVGIDVPRLGPPPSQIALFRTAVGGAVARAAATRRSAGDCKDGISGIAWTAIAVSLRRKIFHFLSTVSNNSPKLPIVSDGPTINSPPGFKE